jgi:hypothetical protein
MSTIDNLLDGIQIPKMVKVRQTFPRPRVENVEEELTEKLQTKGVASLIKQGQRIAIGVGSRGITDLPLMVKIIVNEIKKAGGNPFIVPAMGSHGGATAEGQKDMLIRMGINEEYIGAPIHATMETVQIGTTANGLPVRIDKYASEADAIVVINRIKPHPAFRGPYESGLMKMITIGLGKQKGADICHDLGFGKMAENVPAIANVIREKTNLIFAVGVLENAYHEVCRIEVLENREIPVEEPKLLEEAKGLIPRIQLDEFEVLVIDQIGKDISGTGFDTNAVGRYHTPYASGGPKIAKITALDLTDKTHGNGNGLGILDFTTRRAFEKFDMEMTYPNALTSTVPLSVKIPMVLKSDKQSIQAAIKTGNILDKANVRMVRIKNTNYIGEIEVSESLIEEVKQNKYLEIMSEPYELNFDSKGNLF